MLNIIAIIFVFGVLVFIHELGHFLAAKWMGVRVEKFSIGFPPTLFSKKIGETEFQISAIPLGGYVKMAGFLDESMDTEITGADYEFSSKPVWRRIIIISGGVIMNLLLAIVVLAVLNFSEGEKIIPNTTIDIVGEGGVGEKVGFQKGDKVLQVNGSPVNNWNEVQEIFIDNLNKDVQFMVLRDGTEQTLLYKKEWFASEKGEQLDVAPFIPSKVGEVSPGMPAEEAGLLRGDVIHKIDDHKVTDWQEMTELIRVNPGQEIDIVWQRNGSEMSAKITPQKFEETDGEGIIEDVGKIGINYYFEQRDIGIVQSIINGVDNTFGLIYLNMRGLWWVISGTKSAKEIIGGPIMIAKMAGDAAQAGWTYLWYLIAALSSILAFFNILPIPVLDGGHLVFLIIEGIMGKPLSIKVRLKIQQVGMALLLSFIVFILYVDIKRLFF